MKKLISKIQSLLNEKKWLAFLVFFIIIFAVYARSITFDYSFLDDQQLLIDNAQILERANFVEIFTNDVFFTKDSGFYYRPLLNYSFVFDRHLSNASIHFSHLSNIFYHFLAVSLLFIVLGLSKVSKEKAFFLTLLFAVHPALTQAVVWIPGRNDTLLAIFTFLFLIVLHQFLKLERIWDLIILGFIFLAALLIKESAILIAPLALFWAYLFQREYLNRFKILSTGAVLFVVSFIWYLARSLFLVSTSLKELSFLLFENLLSPLVYLGKVFFPFNLSIYSAPADVIIWPGLITLLIILAVLIYQRGRNYFVTVFGLVWFWLFLVMASLRPDGNSGANFMDHRLYLAVFGIIIIVSQWRVTKVYFRIEKILASLYFITFIILIVLSYRHSSYFRNPITFWERATITSPNSAFAQRNLGAVYYLDGRLDDALNVSKKSLTINGNEPMVNSNMATIYLDQGKYDEARYHLDRELNLNPNYDLAWYNLARLHFLKGDYVLAKKYYLQTLAINPKNIRAMTDLRRLYDLEKE